MKKTIVAILFFAFRLVASGQGDVERVDSLFKGKLNGDLIRSIYSHYLEPRGYNQSVTLALFHSNKLFPRTGLEDDAMPAEVEKFKRQKDSLRQVSKTGERPLPAAVVPLYDSSGILATAYGINRSNVHDYEYRVVENMDRVIVPWREISLFCDAYTLFTNPDGSEQTEMAYLGSFKTTFGNSLTIELRKKSGTALPHSISALWINRSPKVIATFSNEDMTAFLDVFKYQWKHDFLPPTTSYYGDFGSKPVDSLLVARNTFRPRENNIIFYLNDKIRSRELVEYNLLSGKKQTGWKPNNVDANLVWLKNLSPGRYVLQLRYSMQRQNISEYPFSLLPAWYQTTFFKISAGLLCLATAGFIFLVFKSRKQRLQLRFEQLQKEQTRSELKSIRSQFNPHFVFNALNSIQGLITRKDMENANRYLSEFSSLLRDSLRESNREMISLSEEIRLLETYLKLEQLRFGFNYTISIDKGMNAHTVEIPALLIQPLAENAVKHGIASLYENGTLAIGVTCSLADMILAISDNGKGFDPGNISKGYGLRLTKERIALLNTTLRGQEIILSVDSSAQGTTVYLKFQNWLS